MTVNQPFIQERENFARFLSPQTSLFRTVVITTQNLLAKKYLVTNQFIVLNREIMS